MISILDYGLGNLKAFKNIFDSLNLPCQIVNNKSDLLKAKKIIFPGVGSFDQAMYSLEASGMREVLDFVVLEKKVFVLGICVAMQMMAEESEEGSSSGLSWIPAKVKKIESNGKDLCIPHMGWNDVKPIKKNRLFLNMKDPKFYFLHSYHFVPNDECYSTSITEYNLPLIASINHENIFGVQFHPEKSHKFGIDLLSNFASL